MRRTGIESEIISKLMKEIRLSLRLSKVELHELSDISRQSITYYEAGTSMPNLENLDKWLLAITKEIRKNRKKAISYDKQRKLKKEVEDVIHERKIHSE
jgi:transcriptional regulator with XRE-family HTH domain